MSMKKGLAALIAVCLVAGAAGAALYESVSASDAATGTMLPSSKPIEAEPIVNRVPSSREEMQLSFSPLVKRATPAVVNVYATRKVQTRMSSPFFNDPFFQQFFGNNSFGAPRERIERSLGSGVIIDPAGVIVTNHHVIEGASEVKVALSDRTEFEADIVLDDERTDLAVLRINDNKKALPYLQFADSDKVEVGDLVLAIGNPFGVGQTVTSGIVSAMARTHVGASDYQYFIQTDAAINPGNSGGALIGMDGKLVGINSAIFTKSGGSNGIGFAIPANMVHMVANAALAGKAVERPWFGGKMQQVTTDIAEGLGLSRPQGVLITGIIKNSPADEAGLKIGDLILSMNDYAIDNLETFDYRFATMKLGEKVRLNIIRKGREREIDLVAKVPPENPKKDRRLLKGYSPFAGAAVVNLSPAVVIELGLGTSKVEGVVVSEVTQGSTAARLGVKVGDIIRKINGETVRNTKAMEKLTSQNFRQWRLELERNGKVIKTMISG